MIPEKAQWLKNRLQTMEPGEICARLSDVGRHIALRATLKGIRQRAQRSVEDSPYPLRIPERNGRFTEVPGEMQDQVIATATQWLNHRANFFALRDVSLGDPIVWHRDYSSNIRSPMRYSALINHRDVAVVGNVKYVWELNRLHQLVLLALAALWTGSDTYREEITRQTLSWHTQNPFMKGLNWKSPLEAGIRLLSWAFVAFLIRGASQTRDLFPKSLREVIYQHQYFIRKFYAKHSSANNHLIGEMAGLYVGSVFWPWYRESTAWQSFARQKLIQEMARQIEPDGVGKERATEYQLFILELFLLAGVLGQAIGDPFPPVYWQRLTQMITFLSAISDRAGNLPRFGDGDSGQVIWLPETMRERARALIQLGYRCESSAVTSDLRPLLLLWGHTAAEIPLAPVPVSASSLQMFPHGGYSVLALDRGRADELVVVFDTGPLGFPPLYAHGHADALSFWLSYGGHEFLIDPGTFCYHTNALWRLYFRGTAAHNTVRIDGEDQSIPGGTFLWRQVAHGHTERAEDTAECISVEGSHDGYQRLGDPVRHWRTLHLYKKSRTLIITDRLECHSTHTVEILFHFSEQCHVRQMGADTFQIANSNRYLRLCLDSRLEPTLYRGSEHPRYGWVSRTFDVKEPCFTLVARARVTGATQFLTKIVAISS
jgi:hypothetical protein